MDQKDAGIAEKTADILADVFCCCPTVTQHQILKQTEIKKIADDTVFIKPGDILSGIYIVIDGGVKLYQQFSGKPKVIQYHSAKDIVGFSMMINDQKSNYFALAMDDLVLAYIPKDLLNKLMQENPHSFFSLLKKMNEKAHRIESLYTSVMADPAEKTVMKAISDLQNRFGTDGNGYVKVKIPVKELAGYVGMSKTSLYRILQGLKEKSLLSHHLDRYKLSKSTVS